MPAPALLAPLNASHPAHRDAPAPPLDCPSAEIERLKGALQEESRLRRKASARADLLAWQLDAARLEIGRLRDEGGKARAERDLAAMRLMERRRRRVRGFLGAMALGGASWAALALALAAALG